MKKTIIILFAFILIKSDSIFSAAMTEQQRRKAIEEEYNKLSPKEQNELRVKIAEEQKQEEEETAQELAAKSAKSEELKSEEKPKDISITQETYKARQVPKEDQPQEDIRLARLLSKDVTGIVSEYVGTREEAAKAVHQEQLKKLEKKLKDVKAKYGKISFKDLKDIKNIDLQEKSRKLFNIINFLQKKKNSANFKETGLSNNLNKLFDYTEDLILRAIAEYGNTENLATQFKILTKIANNFDELEKSSSASQIPAFHIQKELFKQYDEIAKMQIQLPFDELQNKISSLLLFTPAYKDAFIESFTLVAGLRTKLSPEELYDLLIQDVQKLNKYLNDLFVSTESEKIKDEKLKKLETIYQKFKGLLKAVGKPDIFLEYLDRKFPTDKIFDEYLQISAPKEEKKEPAKIEPLKVSVPQTGSNEIPQEIPDAPPL